MEQSKSAIQSAPTSPTHPRNAIENISLTKDEGGRNIDNAPFSSRNNEAIRNDDRIELRRLATQLSRQDSYLSASGNVLDKQDTLEGIDLHHPALNPESDQFDAYRFARYLMRDFQNQDVKERHSGFMFKDLNVSGSGSGLSYQNTVGSLLMAPLRASEYFDSRKKPEKQILQNFNGYLRRGEMLVVLGRPGSGCSTLLKTIAGELKGLNLGQNSTIHYDGIEQGQMLGEFRGELTYNQEVDKHFPHLTVGETLEFAASSRTSQKIQSPLYTPKAIAAAVMAVFGLTAQKNTKVGNDYVRGVSGGERKRVSIAEMAVGGAPIACWDNSTRGLDAATALEFTKALRIASDVSGSTSAVAIYQASQAIYDLFDKAVVLYEGREIYYGPCDKAVEYFVNMGWEKPSRQTSADFLTAVTNPHERKARSGMESKVPRTPEEFDIYWKRSSNQFHLQNEIARYEKDYPPDSGGQVAKQFKESKIQQQPKHANPNSPYLLSIPKQVKLTTSRAYRRLWNDKTSTLSTVIGQIAIGLIVGSLFYGTPDATDGFFAKGASLFFAVLLNALISVGEINALYDQRPIVEKQTSYAFYHPFTEAFGGIVSDIPVKFFIAVGFNIVLYFLTGLRREPGPFFIYFLIVFISTLAMSAIFRTLAAATKSIAQAMAFAGVMVLAIIIYTGFTIPRPQMHPWFEWISYINPVFYAFEAIIANEFHGRRFECSQYVPAPPASTGNNFICASKGAFAGERFVSGDAFIQESYNYSYSHLWRNFGVLIAFLIFFDVLYLVATELNSSSGSSAEFLVFRRGHMPEHMQNLDKGSSPEEPGDDVPVSSAKDNAVETGEVGALRAQKNVFTWKDVTYDIPVKGGERRLLDSVSGWVKPGTLTALMGVSGAGKTTLLDVLAQRVSIGLITGDMFVNGKPLDQSFQRKTGYVQQQDVHMKEATVREALRFSAMLRQPPSVPKQEKYDYVEEVIKMLGMEDFAEAVIGSPGEGLNVEQRKLLSISVELAAKPDLLLFLDEPTSGLDSQSSWGICTFLKKLADNGQAVLSTIHQPSALLFQQFDRLLFLAKGGKTVYFGDIGANSRTLLSYFEDNGARPCGQSENPAEYMLEMVGAGAAGKSEQDWPSLWKQSQEAKYVQEELKRIHHDKQSETDGYETGSETQKEFAMPLLSQLWHVTYRIFQQYWRQPAYIYGKLLLGLAASLFIGFSFWRPPSSQQGLQDILFSCFMLTSIFSTLVQQIMPRFIEQRSLYEVRERPSKAYSWAAFLISNIVVEVPYQMLLGIISWASYYYPIYTSGQSGERQGLMLLLIVEFFVFASSFAHLVIAAMPDAETGGSIATLMFSMMLSFNGVMQAPDRLPKFWIFMYRVSPLTYLISALGSTGLHSRSVECSSSELSVFEPPTDLTCGDYLEQYLTLAPGRLLNPLARGSCQYCPVSNADQFLATSNIYWEERWRNFGIVLAYIAFNIVGATGLYYIFRVRNWSPTTLVTGIRDSGGMVGRLFKRRTGSTPKGKEAENNRIY
ncbi:MAG: hypothetical protein M1831_003158 [Alyxoria varia]|nr:MAG: hypothetical protein M1831_003158 [Alyxoria varia]